LVFFLSLVLVSGSVATVLTLQGFWLVLPFAGLELVAVGTGLYVVSRRCYECEVISIAGDAVRVEKGRNYPRERWTFARIWAHAVLEHCPSAWYPSRLLIRSHGRAVEVGRFLNEEERRQLASDLRESL
jgi:uncharacterized membrane protein